jgi:hypothetical protein
VSAMLSLQDLLPNLLLASILNCNIWLIIWEHYLTWVIWAYSCIVFLFPITCLIYHKFIQLFILIFVSPAFNILCSIIEFSDLIHLYLSIKFLYIRSY